MKPFGESNGILSVEYRCADHSVPAVTCPTAVREIPAWNLTVGSCVFVTNKNTAGCTLFLHCLGRISLFPAAVRRESAIAISNTK